MIWLYALGLISVAIACFGMEGRGAWSKNIASGGGILWLVTIILGFIYLDLKGGIYFLIGTLVLGAILIKILRPILNPHGH